MIEVNAVIVITGLLFSLFGILFATYQSGRSKGLYEAVLILDKKNKKEIPGYEFQGDSGGELYTKKAELRSGGCRRLEIDE